MIPDYYLLTFPTDEGEPCPADLYEMLALGMARAQSLARERIGDPGAYSVLFSGYSARREHDWHVHIVLLTRQVEEDVAVSGARRKERTAGVGSSPR